MPRLDSETGSSIDSCRFFTTCGYSSICTLTSLAPHSPLGILPILTLRCPVFPSLLALRTGLQGHNLDLRGQNQTEGSKQKIEVLAHLVFQVMSIWIPRGVHFVYVLYLMFIVFPDVLNVSSGGLECPFFRAIRVGIHQFSTVCAILKLPLKTSFSILQLCWSAWDAVLSVGVTRRHPWDRGSVIWSSDYGQERGTKMSVNQTVKIQVSECVLLNMFKYSPFTAIIPSFFNHMNPAKNIKTPNATPVSGQYAKKSREYSLIDLGLKAENSSSPFNTKC